ncbi:Myo-inositol-1-phosphate synthase [Candidatus Gugararchaeum adminiculabundum]|nr:Myo-inositol-1-phosphate synthase [Candidatus Gugararchaeum adminiculabundum]
MAKINCGVIGIGNCFAGLYQGLEYYKRNPGRKIVGLMHENMGGYSLQDVEFTSAFDVGKNKIGKSLDQAIMQPPNMVDWVKNMPPSKVVVKESPVLDGVGIYVQNKIDPVKNRDIAILRKEVLAEIASTKTKVLVNYLPVGSQKAVEWWAEIALESGCAFVNNMPVFIASRPEWEAKFRKANLPILGDDTKGMIGATIVHRTLARLCDERGAEIDSTYQINVGGNTDFLNMKEQERLESKKISKTESVQSQLSKRLPDDKIYIGPSDFIPFLRNTKLAFIRVEGKMWADIPFNFELRLDVDDKANSAGIVIDAIRAAQIALDRKVGGAVEGASAYLMKHPPKQFTDPEARKAFDDFIAGKRER